MLCISCGCSFSRCSFSCLDSGVEEYACCGVGSFPRALSCEATWEADRCVYSRVSVGCSELGFCVATRVLMRVAMGAVLQRAKERMSVHMGSEANEGSTARRCLSRTPGYRTPWSAGATSLGTHRTVRRTLGVSVRPRPTARICTSSDPPPQGSTASARAIPPSSRFSTSAPTTPTVTLGLAPGWFGAPGRARRRRFPEVRTSARPRPITTWSSLLQAATRW